jgi:hypothetical protein
MTHAAEVKYLSFIPIHLYEVSTISGSQFGLSVSITEQIWKQRELRNLSGIFASNKMIDNADFICKTQITDSLLASVGTPEFGISNISAQHNDSIEEVLLTETREVNKDSSQETQVTDPLLTLAEMLECDVPEIKKQFKDSISPKARVVKGVHANDPDPLIALLGTLECDVTDIGERHDEYIGDALLAELWGDEDE